MDVLQHDKLTKLPSLYYFGQLLERRLAQAQPEEYEAIAIDIDSFKTINTVFGMETGTHVIQTLGRVLQSLYEPQGGLVTRVTAEQFYIFHRTLDDTDLRLYCEEEISEAIRSLLGRHYNLSLSAGVYRIADPKMNVVEIYNRAAIARHKGKQIYKNTIYYMDTAMEKEERDKSNIVFRMESALQDREFYVLYQPKVDLKSMEVSGAELLVRWLPKHSEGEIYPNEFIHIFESNGFIVELDLFVFEEACTFIEAQRARLPVPILSTNLSGPTLADDKFPTDFFGVMSRHGVKPTEVEFELTESALALPEAVVQEKVAELRRAGCRIAIDDFGTGSSTLEVLTGLEVDSLKLDKAFLDRNFGQMRGAIVVKDVIRMARTIGIKVICEGVQTEKQLKWLQNIGCDMAQGYYFAKPMSEEDFTALLGREHPFSE